MLATASGWLFGALLVATGIANFVLVHPVPAAAYLLASLIYFPPSSAALTRALGWRPPVAIKVIAGVAILWFTLGISDLGDMID